MRVSIIRLAIFALAINVNARGQDRDVNSNYLIHASNGQAVIPFELHGGDILLKPEINGKILRLVLDNGVLWDALLLYGRTNVDYGLTFDGHTQLGTAGDPTATKARTASGITVRLPGVELKNQTAVVTPPESLFSKLFTGQDGIISGSLFSHFIVSIDFERMIVTLSDPKHFSYKGGGQALTMTPSGGGTYGLACVLTQPSGKHVKLNPAMDIAGVQPLLLYIQNCADILVPNTASEAVLGPGLQGHLGPVPELTVGKYTLKNVTTGFTRSKARMGEKCEGLFGLPFFWRFHCTFDYRNRVVYLEPNAHFDDTFLRRSRERQSQRSGGEE